MIIIYSILPFLYCEWLIFSWRQTKNYNLECGKEIQRLRMDFIDSGFIGSVIFLHFLFFFYIDSIIAADLILSLREEHNLLIEISIMSNQNIHLTTLILETIEDVIVLVSSDSVTKWTHKPPYHTFGGCFTCIQYVCFVYVLIWS